MKAQPKVVGEIVPKKRPKTHRRRTGIELLASDSDNRMALRVVSDATTPEAQGQLDAAMNVDPVVRAASSTRGILRCESNGGPGINELVAEIDKQADAVRAGDMSRVEEMLLAQAHTLDGLFNALAGRAMLNMAQYPDAFERYMRLALKGQTQCRATLETLALVKNPPNVAFVRQANIGQAVQVNNGDPASRARELSQIPTNKLLGPIDGERLDLRATEAAGRSDQGLEAVGSVHGAQDRGRESRR